MNFKEWKIQQLKNENLKYSPTGCKGVKKGDLVGIWKTKYVKNKYSSKQRKIEFSLTFDEYLYKAFEAGLEDPNQIGRGSNCFSLGRYKDQGSYSNSNCRFISKEIQTKERNEHYNPKSFRHTEETKKKISMTKLGK